MVDAFNYEDSDGYAIKISVATALGINRDEVDRIRRAGEKIINQIREMQHRRDSTTIDKRKEEKEKLIDLFGREKIYVEEINNEYMLSWYARPWLRITTSLGHFKIGWRKGVIHLEWTETAITATVEDLFSKENVTKEDKLIHCHGYDKAREYLGVLLSWKETQS